MALTEDAKQELAEAIRIVREDNFEKFVRQSVGKTPPTPTPDPLLDPNDPTPPPPKVEPNDPPKPTRSGYWGELFSE
jgi:hypothetical protein